MRKNKSVNFYYLGISLLLVFCWMGVIFWFSSLEGDGNKYQHSFWFYFERKGAHVAEFFILTLLLINLFLKRYAKIGDVVLISGLISFLYALLDEIHQLFVFGREGKFTDIGFDLAGIILAGGLFIGLLKFKKTYKWF